MKDLFKKNLKKYQMSINLTKPFKIWYLFHLRVVDFFQLGTCCIRSDTFSPEEVHSMILVKMRDIAKNYMEISAKDHTMKINAVACYCACTFQCHHGC